MRTLACYQIPGASVQEVLDEFNERRDEFGIPDEDIVSVSAMPARVGERGTIASVEVLIVYWKS